MYPECSLNSFLVYFLLVPHDCACHPILYHLSEHLSSFNRRNVHDNIVDFPWPWVTLRQSINFLSSHIFILATFKTSQVSKERATGHVSYDKGSRFNGVVFSLPELNGPLLWTARYLARVTARLLLQEWKALSPIATVKGHCEKKVNQHGQGPSQIDSPANLLQQPHNFELQVSFWLWVLFVQRGLNNLRKTHNVRSKLPCIWCVIQTILAHS